MKRRLAWLCLLMSVSAVGAAQAPDPRLIVGELNTLAMAPDPSARERVVAWLDHGDPGVRRAAVRALGYLGDPSVLPMLERFGADPDPNLRVAYLFALMRLGDAGAMTAHAGMAKDADGRVRLAAEAGLTRFGLADRRESLLETLKKRDLGEVSIAASGLVLVGGGENLRAVAGLLDHPMDEVRGLGAQALGDAPPEAFILEKLIRVHDGETYSYVSAALGQAVARVGARDPALMARLLPSARHKEGLVALLKQGPAAEQVENELIALLAGKDRDPLPVLEALRHFDGGAAGAALRGRAFDAALPPAVRAPVIRWLGERKDQASRDLLRKALDDPAPEVRAEACYALSRLNDRASAPRALELLKDPDPLVVKAALAALRNYRYLPGKGAVEAMLDHPDAEVRGLAGEARDAIKAKEVIMTQELHRLGHDAMLVRWRDKAVYFDPFQLPEGLPKADVILITHDHHDHLSPEDIGKIAAEGTVIVLPRIFSGKAKGLPGTIQPIAAGETVTVEGLEVRAVPAYNPGKKYHPKSYGGVGYFVTIGRTVYYHAGDTDLIPEMKRFPPADVCFLPVSGTYVMTAGEAAEATKILKCGKAIPMHYGAIIGGEGDAEEFKRKAACPVEILPLADASP